MKKISYCLIMFLFLSGILYAQGDIDSERAEDEKVSITWASWALAEEALKPIYMSMVNSFMEENPNILVETVAYPYAQYKDQLIISASADNAPDVAHIKEEWVAPLMELDALLPLNDLLSKEVHNDFIPEILNGVTINGDIVCVPWFNNPYAMFYNKTLLEKAGVNVLPKNWDQLMDAAYKISALGEDAKGNKIYGYAQPNSKTEPGVGYNFFPVMWAYGGDFINEKGEIVIDSPENVAAFKNVKELYLDKVSPNGTNFKDLRNLFAQGVIGFYYDIEMAAAPINEASPKGEDFSNEYSTMVIPEKSGPNGYGYLIQHHNVIFDTCKEKEAAVKFAEFLSDKEVLQILYDAGMGKMATRSTVLDMEIFKNPEKKISKAFVQALPTARPLPTANENFMKADELIADTLTKLTISKEPVEKIVSDLDDDVTELYKE